jgi:predicted phosphodiesterase
MRHLARGRPFGAALLVVAGAFGGALVALNAAPARAERFSLGTVEARVVPAREGEIDVYTPVVDWGVRVRPYRSPVAVRLELRALDREAALASLRSGEAASASARSVRRDLDGVVREALARAALVGGLGALVGGTLAGALLAAGTRRRSWLAHGAFAGALVALASIGAVALDLRHADPAAFRAPEFYARGAELPHLLEFSEQILTAGERYTESYDTALRSLANVVAAGSRGVEPEGERTHAIVASDLHSNSLVLPALTDFAHAKTLYFVGDFTQLGTRVESGVAADVAAAGTRVVAVSGNHDSHAFMRSLAAAGALVLTRDGVLAGDGTVGADPVVEVDGLAVAGYDDPLENRGSLGEQELGVEGEELGAQAEAFVAWFDRLPERPDIVLVHRHALAHALLDSVAADEDGEPLLILTGHDHDQHYHVEGPHVMVDGGTVGAGGVLSVGEAPAGFAQLHLGRDGRLEALDLIEVEPISGEASARRVVFPQDKARR